MSFSPPESGRHLKHSFAVCLGWGWAPVTFKYTAWLILSASVCVTSDCTAVSGLSCHTKVSKGYSFMSSGRDTGYKAILPFQRNYPSQAEQVFCYSIWTEKLKKWSICYKGTLIIQRTWNTNQKFCRIRSWKTGDRWSKTDRNESGYMSIQPLRSNWKLNGAVEFKAVSVRMTSCHRTHICMPRK